jgi:hypothetical protein
VVREALPADCLVVAAGALGDVGMVGPQVMDPEELRALLPKISWRAPDVVPPALTDYAELCA